MELKAEGAERERTGQRCHAGLRPAGIDADPIFVAVDLGIADTADIEMLADEAQPGSEDIRRRGKRPRAIGELESEMLAAADALEFERAALLRDEVRELKRMLAGGEVKRGTVKSKGRRNAGVT